MGCDKKAGESPSKERKTLTKTGETAINDIVIVVHLRYLKERQEREEIQRVAKL